MTLDTSSAPDKVCDALVGWGACPEQVLPSPWPDQLSRAGAAWLFKSSLRIGGMIRIAGAQVLLVDGLAPDTVGEAEALLLKLTGDKALVCPAVAGGTRATDQWTVVLVSGLGGPAWEGEDGGVCRPAGEQGGVTADEAKKAVQRALLAAARDALVPQLYQTATKSVLYKAAGKAVVPFLCAAGAAPDAGRAKAGGAPQPVEWEEGGGARHRRKLVEGCLAAWRERRAARAAQAGTFDLAWLRANFLGQDVAVDQVSSALRNKLEAWGRREKPLVMVFLGPSGTGKTELARRIASVVHAAPLAELLRDKRFVQIPMGQYKDKNSADNLVGPPVGIEGTGQLTGALLENPDAVVLLDEFEKAHPEAIPDVLLSAFDGSGGFKDTKLNRYVDTTKALFIINTNMGADAILQRAGDLGAAYPLRRDTPLVRQVRRAVGDAIAAAPAHRNPFARAEFRGRVDEWVSFFPYTAAEKRAVAAQTLEASVLSYYLEEAPPARRMAVGWDPSALGPAPSISFFSPRACLSSARHGADARGAVRVRVEWLAGQYGGEKGDQGFRPMMHAIGEVNTLLREAWDRGSLRSGSPPLPRAPRAPPRMRAGR